MEKESDNFVNNQLKFINDHPNKIIKKYKPKATKTLAQRLMTKPIADKGEEIPHFSTDIKDNRHHQADLLYLPVDNKSKYALVVADVGSRLIDAYEVDKILDKKKINYRVHYLVKWLGFGPAHNTWEPRSMLLQDVPELIKVYDRDN